MSREILFRGKRLDNGGGETGSLIIIRWGCSDARHYITDKMTGYPTPIDPATVGQFTGLCDKNGVKIFEGDEVETSCGEIGIIEYLEEDGMFIISFPITSGHSSWIATFGDLDGNEMEVIGNIHDKEKSE